MSRNTHETIWVLIEDKLRLLSSTPGSLAGALRGVDLLHLRDLLRIAQVRAVREDVARLLASVTEALGYRHERRALRTTLTVMSPSAIPRSRSGRRRQGWALPP